MNESTGIRGRVVRDWKEGRKEAVGPSNALTPTPMSTHQALGGHEKFLVFSKSDCIPQVAKSLPETSLALRENLTHQN